MDWGKLHNWGAEAETWSTLIVNTWIILTGAGLALRQLLQKTEMTPAIAIRIGSLVAAWLVVAFPFFWGSGLTFVHIERHQNSLQFWPMAFLFFMALYLPWNGVLMSYMLWRLAYPRYDTALARQLPKAESRSKTAQGVLIALAVILLCAFVAIKLTDLVQKQLRQSDGTTLSSQGPSLVAKISKITQ